MKILSELHVIIFGNFLVLSSFVQNLVATKLGVQRITGVTVFDKREKKTYEPLPDLEVCHLCNAALSLVQVVQMPYILKSSLSKPSNSF